MTKIIHSKDSLQNLHIEDQFYYGAHTLRDTFTTRFENPLHATSDRFCWDYWRVPDQYRLLRTPAESFFGTKPFKPFLEHLLNWGRSNLGCQMISHPWLSAYIDGCYQSLHSDVPHGPWSFVYSLTPWNTRKFTGGETVIAKPKLLRYFQEVTHHQSDEHAQLFQKVEPKFNRLTVFDPRYPHGVQSVKGEEDLLASRLVIHGWFTEPRPMLEGTLPFKKIMKPLDLLALSIIHLIEPLKYSGLLSIRFHILGSGKIGSAQVLCAHLINPMGETLHKTALNKMLLQALMNNEIIFPKSNGPTTLTLPIEFKK